MVHFSRRSRPAIDATIWDGRQEEVLRLRQAGMTQEQIGFEFGISQQRVSQIERIAAASQHRATVDDTRS